MSRPHVIRSVAAMQEACWNARNEGTVALVPTMGALHEGHLSLVRAAKQACDTVVVSIFVNPAQFGPGEDLSRYPRTWEHDLALLRQEDVAFVFAPSVEEIYPDGAGTVVEVNGIGDRLDGKFRPGHFRGVATIVAKLFHITMPHMAFFGQKDAAQVAVLRAMVRDLNFPLKMIVCPTVREEDGLAMSSRNRYLSDEERERALVLCKALQAAQHAAGAGAQQSECLRHIMREHIASAQGVALEYAEVVSPDLLLPVETVANGALLAVAVKIGGTRLIDNILLPPMQEAYSQ